MTDLSSSIFAAFSQAASNRLCFHEPMFDERARVMAPELSENSASMKSAVASEWFFDTALSLTDFAIFANDFISDRVYESGPGAKRSLGCSAGAQLDDAAGSSSVSDEELSTGGFAFCLCSSFCKPSRCSRGLCFCFSDPSSLPQVLLSSLSKTHHLGRMSYVITCRYRCSSRSL